MRALWEALRLTPDINDSAGSTELITDTCSFGGGAAYWLLRRPTSLSAGPALLRSTSEPSRPPLCHVVSFLSPSDVVIYNIRSLLCVRHVCLLSRSSVRFFSFSALPPSPSLLGWILRDSVTWDSNRRPGPVPTPGLCPARANSSSPIRWRWRNRSAASWPLFPAPPSRLRRIRRGGTPGEICLTRIWSRRL